MSIRDLWYLNAQTVLPGHDPPRSKSAVANFAVVNSNQKLSVMLGFLSSRSLQDKLMFQNATFKIITPRVD